MSFRLLCLQGQRLVVNLGDLRLNSVPHAYSVVVCRSQPVSRLSQTRGHEIL